MGRYFGWSCGPTNFASYRQGLNNLCNLSRHDCFLVIRSLTGDWLVGIDALRLSSPYNDFGRSCRDEEEEESPKHFFCSCPAFSSRRHQTLSDPLKKSSGIPDSTLSAAASTSKSCQSANVVSEMVTMPADPTKTATPEMVTMPAGQAKGAGPSKTVFHPGLGVEGVILPPSITSELRQSAKSAAVPPAGARTVGVAPTAGAKKKFSFTERRSAGDILQRNHNCAVPNQSAEWLRKVDWARSVIPDWKPSSKAQAQAKRQRSQETPAPNAKKSRVQQGRSFAQIAKERILIGVLDRGNLEGGIPRSQWRWVESALAIHCFNLLEREPGPPPICKDLYKAAVDSVGEVYPGAKLEAVNWDEVPVRPRARMWIPSTFKEPEQLLKMLQRCNPRLPTQDWRVAKIEETPGPTHQAVIILNKESLAPIDAAGGELNFGFSSVFIRVYKSDAAVGGAPSGKPAEEDITAELEAPERPEMDGYTSDASSLTRDLRKLWQAGDLEVTSDLASEDEDADITVVECGLCGSITPSGWRRSGRGPNPGTLDGVRNEDNTTVSLELQLAPIRLLSAYMAYDHVGPLPVDFTRDLIKDCDDNKIALLIGCDANAHHTQWGSSNTNVRAFLDIEGAFNNVFPDAITGALTSLGVEGRLVGLINQLLTSRAVTSTLGSSTLTRSCRDEEEEESPEHFFCSCPALSNRRLHTLGKPFLDDLSGLSAIPPRKIALFIQSSNWTPF
ncbi:hypothetical protein ACLKA7_001306 [Drosophila subpalustris]